MAARVTEGLLLGDVRGSLPGDTVLSVPRYAGVERSLPGVNDQRPHGEAGLPAVCVCHLIGQTQTQAIAIHCSAGRR